jgi:1-phosphofructokinase family hexose kinase
LDVLYKLDELELGATLLDIASDTHPAGKALNVAKVVKTLGEEVCIIGIVPENDEKRFNDYCKQLGIKAEFITVEGSVRINATISETERNVVTHINSMGPALSEKSQEEILQLMQKRLSPGDTWVFSGSIPEGFDNDIYKKMIQECRKKKALSLLDSRGKALKMGARAKPDMLKPNLAELEQYFGEQIQGVHHIALKGKKLIDLGIDYAFISLGSDGMIAIHENDCLLCSPPTVKVVDTVGSGDALAAGIVVAQKRHHSFSEMCRLAIACGASNAMHAGPGNIVSEEVFQLMEEVKIENA